MTYEISKGLLLICLIYHSALANILVKTEKTLRQKDRAEQHRDPNTCRLTCVARYYDNPSGWKDMPCTDEVSSVNIQKTNKSGSVDWVFTAEVSARASWFSLKFQLCSTYRSIVNYMGRGPPVSISHSAISPGVQTTLHVWHEDKYWASLGQYCSCQNGDFDCSRFLQCSRDISVAGNRLDDSPNFFTQCQIIPPFGESLMTCYFSYLVQGGDISPPLSHIFDYRRTRPKPPTVMTIEVQWYSKSALLDLSALASNESFQTMIIFHCIDSVTRIKVKECTFQIKDSKPCRIELWPYPGRFYNFTASSFSPYQLNPLLENSRVISESRIFLGPKNLTDAKITKMENAHYISIQLVLQAMNTSTQSHVNISFYTENNTRLRNVETKIYALVALHAENIPSYSININLTSPLFVPSKSYELQITALSCLSNCSPEDKKLSSENYIAVDLKAPDKPLGPVEISVNQRNGQDNTRTYLVSWRASQVTVHDNFIILICQEKQFCKRIVNNYPVTQLTNQGLNYSTTFTLLGVGYHYVQIQPLWKEIVGDGKTKSLIIVPEMPINLLAARQTRWYIEITWKMKIPASYNFTVKLCQLNDYTQCLKVDNISGENMVNTQYSYTLEFNTALAEASYLLSVQPFYDLLAGKAAKTELSVEKDLTSFLIILLSASLLILGVTVLCILKASQTRLSPIESAMKTALDISKQNRNFPLSAEKPKIVERKIQLRESKSESTDIKELIKAVTKGQRTSQIGGAPSAAEISVKQTAEIKIQSMMSISKHRKSQMMVQRHPLVEAARKKSSLLPSNSRKSLKQFEKLQHAKRNNSKKKSSVRPTKE